MAKLFVVGGVSTDSLCDYLREKGSFEILGEATSLVTEENSLKNKTIFVDKLILFLQDRSLKFKQEIMSLRELVLGRYYFSFSELYVFVRSDTDVDLRELNTILERFAEDVDKKETINNISIKITANKSDYTFEDIYNVIIGSSYIDSLENKRIARIRKPIGDDSKYAYAPQDDTALILKPYDYKNIIRHSEIEKNALMADDGTRIIEKKSKYKKSDKTIPLIEESSPQRCKVIVVSGDKGSGKSILATALAYSASAVTSKKICFLDLTGRSIYPSIFNSGMVTSIPFSKITLSELFLSNKRPSVVKHSFTYISEMDKIPAYRRPLHLLNILKSVDELPYDVLLVETGLESIDEIKSLMKSYISLFIYTVPSRKVDITKIKEFVDDSSNFLISLTDFMPSTRYNPNISIKEIKGILGPSIKILGSLKLNELEVPRDLYVKIEREALKWICY